MRTKQFISTVLIAVIVSVLSITIYSHFIEKSMDKAATFPTANQTAGGKLVSYPAYSSAGYVDFVEAAELSLHGVVHVHTKSIEEQAYFNPFHNFFFGDGLQYQQRPVLSSGSGVIISNDGYIVTNNHVISGAQEVSITLNNKQNYAAKVVGSDPTTDIALLKIEGKDLPYLVYGNSDDIRVGEWVLAVGNPFNLNSTVTAGIVSAKARNINILSQQYSIESFIQTDAAVNPGNSGGALVNTKGELIGINTAIASRTGSYVGYSFAVPVNIVKKIVADIIEYGEVQRAYIGVNIQDIDATKAKDLGMNEIKGVYITGINEKGAAEEAGIREGDILLYVEQNPVNSTAELQEQISKYRPGDKINVTVDRKNSLKNFTITLKNKHGNTSIVKTMSGEILGARLDKIDESEAKRMRLRNGGVKISSISKGKFEDAGIKEGFIITSINRQRINGVDEVINLLNNLEGGVLIEGIYPNGRVAYYAFGME
jgi:serine protease Do